MLHCLLDDVLIFSDNKEQHLNDLKSVFKRFNEYGIVLNANICIFGQKEVKFLGHLVSFSGLSLLPEKKRNFKKFPFARNGARVTKIPSYAKFLS